MNHTIHVWLYASISDIRYLLICYSVSSGEQNVILHQCNINTMRIYEKGFTLIELLVVISIIGTLSSMVMVGLSRELAKTRDISRVRELLEIRTALELYYAKHGQYPISTGTANHNNWKNDCDTGVTFVIPELITEGIFPGVQDFIPCSTGHYGYSFGSNGRDYKLVSHSELSAANLDNFIDTAQDHGPNPCILDGPKNKEHIAIWTPGATCWIEANTSPY